MVAVPRCWYIPATSVSPNPTTFDTLPRPGDAQAEQAIRLILEETDYGVPSLTTYRRVIVTIGSK
jgi:hypothetical protein